MKKKACVLTMRNPYPPYGGEKIAMYNIIAALNSLGFEIDLIIISDEKEKNFEYYPEYIKNIKYIYISRVQRCLGVIAAFLKQKSLQIGYFSSAQKNIICNNEYELLLVHTIRLMPFRDIIKAKKKIAYFADSIGMNYSKGIDKVILPLKPIYRYESKKLVEIEKKSPTYFDNVIFHSNIDSNYLGIDNKTNVRHIPIVKKRIEGFSPILEKTCKRFLVIANFRSIPNRHIVDEFIKEADVFSGAGYYIGFIGPNLDKKRIKKLNLIKEYKYIGIVENLVDEVINSYGTICNVQIGAGMQNKILDGISNGRAAFASEFSCKPYRQYVVNIEESGIIVFNSMTDLRSLLNKAIENIAEHQKACKNGYSTAELFNYNIVVDNYRKIVF